MCDCKSVQKCFEIPMKSTLFDLWWDGQINGEIDKKGPEKIFV